MTPLFRGGGVHAAATSGAMDGHDGTCLPESHQHRRPDPH